MRDEEERQGVWRDLIKELANNYECIVEINEDVSLCNIKGYKIQYDCFEHIVNNKPLLLAQLSEGSKLKGIYESLKEFQKEIESENWPVELIKDFQSRLKAEKDIRLRLAWILLNVELQFSSSTRTILRQYLIGRFRNRIPS